MPNHRTYLRNFRRHIAVMGKFSTRDDDRLVEADFGEARKRLAFSLYAGLDTGVIGDQETQFQQIVPARLVPEGERGRYKEYNLTGTWLGKILAEGGRPAEMGGRLFKTLLDNLDVVMPFLHHNFDRLLVEAFVEFYSAGKKEQRWVVAKGEFRDFVMHPEVNQRLLAFLRGGSDKNTMEAYLKSFGAAAKRAESEGGFSFKLEGGSDSHLGTIVATLQRFRVALDAGAAGVSPDRARVKRLDDSKALRKVVDMCQVPGHSPEKTSASAYLWDLFETFHDAREEASDILTCEPAYALMVVWALSKMASSDSEDEQSNRIVEEHFREVIEKPGRGFGKGDREDLLKVEAVLLTEALRRTEENENAVAAVLRDNLIDHIGRRATERTIFTKEALVGHLASTFRKLAVFLLPGVEEAKREARQEWDRLENRFEKIRMIYGDGLDGARLSEELAREEDDVKELWAKFEADCEGGLRGMELSQKFAMEFVKHRVKRIESQVQKFISEKGPEFKQLLGRAVDKYRNSVMQMMPKEGGVAQGPAGGSLDGSLPVGAGEEERKKRERADFRARLARRHAREGGGAGSESPGSRSKVSGPGERRGEAGENEARNSGGGSGEGEEAAGAGARELTSLFEPEELGGLAEKYGVEEIVGVAAEQEVVRLRADLFDRREVHKNEELPRERAQIRALLAGEYILGAGEGVLGAPDRSLGPHLLLHMVEQIGKDTEFDGEGRKRLLEDGKEGGAGDIPMEKILRVSEDPADARSEVRGFVTAWHKRAEMLCSLPEEMAELADLNALFEDLEDLEKRGERGRVTIVNETLREHARRRRVEGSVFCRPLDGQRNKPGSVEAAKPPPGIVYVTRQAWEDMGSADLDLLEPLLFGEGDRSDCALWKPDDGKTIVASMKNDYPQLCVWGMPLFVGAGLARGDRSRLPAVLVGGGEGGEGVARLSAAVVYLAGFRPGTGRWKNAIGEDEAELLGRLGEEWGASGPIGAGFTLGEAWGKVLTSDRALAEQCRSGVLTHGLISRVGGAGPPRFADAVYDVWAELGAVHGVAGTRMDTRVELGRPEERLRGADGSAVPASRSGWTNDRGVDLSVGSEDTLIGELFDGL